MTTADLCYLPALELARLIAARELSAVELVETLLTRIETHNDSLNAYITVAADQARETARAADREIETGNPIGPLHGVPVAIKDLLHTRGIRTTGGSLVYENFTPSEDSIVVARLRDAGAIIIGKTNTPEFGFKSTTENRLIGPTRNPWDATKTAGGSSGGAGAATAAGLAPLSIGTDAGGSIRTPASFCGIFGLKPTFGRVPAAPAFGGARSISHTGPMTRTVRDAALMLDVIARASEYDRRSVPGAEPISFVDALATNPDDLHIGWSADLGFAPVDPEIARLTTAAVTAFCELGWQVTPADPAFTDPIDAFNTIIRAENYIATAPLLAAHGDALDPALREFTENGRDISATDYLAAQAERDAMCRALAGYFEQYDLLVTPTLAVPPLTLGERPAEIDGREIHSMSWLGFTYPFNLGGNPAASVPCGFTQSGLPVGLQIVGPRFSDARVLQASAAFERICPWAHHRPRLSA